MIDLVNRATSFAIQNARYQGLKEVTPDTLLLGCLRALSRFGIARVGGLTIDLEALGMDWQREPAASNTPKVAYSDATVAIFDLAGQIARADGSNTIRIEHLLAAFAREENGLMGVLRRTYSIDGAAWRAAVAEIRGPGESAAVTSNGNAREYLTPEEAAETLGVHVQTLRAYIRSGKLPALRLAGERSLRIRHTDLEKVLEPLVPDVSLSEKEK